MLPRVEYSVTVPVPVDAAFKAFQNLERLLHGGICNDVSWVEGKPWQAGSRVRYDFVRPIRTVVTAVVTSISPPRAISLINHAVGVTTEQNVTFGPDPKGGTRIRMTMDAVGKSTELSESAIHEALAFVTKNALDSVAALCRRRSPSATGK
jgi:hypothetical protein